MLSDKQVLELLPWEFVANILVICDRELFEPFDQRVYKEICSMRENGHKVEIITPHSSTELKEFEGINVHCFESKGIPGYRATKIIKKAIELNCDLFYCHELDPLLYTNAVSYTHLRAHET